MQEGLEHVAGLGHSYDTCRARVVHTIVEVINAAGVHDLLAAAPRQQCNISMLPYMPVLVQLFLLHAFIADILSLCQ